MWLLLREPLHRRSGAVTSRFVFSAARPAGVEAEGASECCGEAAERAWEHARIATEPARVAPSHVMERARTPDQAFSGLATEQAVTALARSERQFAGDDTPAADSAEQADPDLPQEQ